MTTEYITNEGSSYRWEPQKGGATGRAGESETEDEEVKLNCIGGARGMDDSEFSVSDDSDASGDDRCTSVDNNDSERQVNKAASCESLDPSNLPFCLHEYDGSFSVLTFVNRCVATRSSCPLARPKAESPARKALSPHDEVENECDSSRSSVGARGVALSLGPQSCSSTETSEVDEGERGSMTEESERLTPVPSQATSVMELPDEEQRFMELGMGASEDYRDDDELIATIPSTMDDSSIPRRIIGVMEDREDLLTVPKSKRVLSSNTLAALNVDAGLMFDSPKRRKSETEINLENDFDNEIPSLTLGPSAVADFATMRTLLQPRSESTVLSSSDEEEIDRRLGEELDNDDWKVKDSDPVPLLTPPESPLTIEVDGSRTMICEWPSNLVVDTALTAISELPSLTLADLDDDFEDQNTDEERGSPSLVKQSSTLTPLLTSMRVGMIQSN